MRDHIKLFIPGPIEVSADTYAAMSAPMIGHRGKDFQELYASVQPGLEALFGTTNGVFLATSSAWGVMEGALRNLVSKKVLNCCCGAFSDKWLDVSKRCGLEAEALTVEWGQAITPDLIDAKLATGDFDALTLVHNETSTGVQNPLTEIAELKEKYPDVMFIVDAVSSLSAVPFEFDELGIDVLLCGTQKAFALPPGLALFAVSEAALAKAATIEGRGYYFDFLEFQKNHEKDMTPSTPCVHTIYGLQAKLEDIDAEGLDERFERHARLNEKIHHWVEHNGFEHFAAEGYRSKSLTCVANTRGIDVPAFNKVLMEDHKLCINGGYGKIKGKTFRISNMGDETDASIDELLDALDDAMAKVAK